MIDIKILMIPFTGAIIGYITNWVAIKLLFHPRKKILGIQGVVPKRKKDIAKRIGEVSPLMLPRSIDKIKDIRFVGKSIHSRIADYFKRGVADKVENLKDEEIEEIILKATKNELDFVVWSGGIIGFLVGCVQAGIMLI